MDPVTAAALACNVIELVSFSKEVADICTDLLETGTVSQYRAREEAAKNLESAVNGLQERLRAKYASNLSRDDELLMDIASKCLDTAQHLQASLQKLKRAPDGGFRDAIKKTLKILAWRKKIERTKRDLDDYEKTLNTCILTRLDSKALEASREFAELRERLASLSLASVRTTQILIDRIDRSASNEKFMNSLHFPDIFSRQEQIGNAHRKTFNWIFEETLETTVTGKAKWADLPNWLASANSNDTVYWLYGKAGSGKSTLMSYVIQDVRTTDALRRWCGHRATLLTPSFFFWNSGSVLQKSVQGLLRSVLYQILSTAPDLLQELSDSNIIAPLLRDAQAWTEHRLLSILDKLVEISISKKIYICYFLDGLDEYDGDKDLLKEWIRKSSILQNIKLCVSSRPEEAYHQAFKHVPQLRLQDLTKNDTRVYIHDRLEAKLLASSKGHDCSSLHCEQAGEAACPYSLMNDILRRASGVFLWVKLVVRDISEGLEAGETIVELLKKLEETPSALEDLYAHMLRKLPKGFQASSAKYFSMMLAMHYIISCKWMRTPPQVLFILSGLTLLDAGLADDTVWEKVSTMNGAFSAESDFEDLLEKLRSRINVCCVGLVEIEDPTLNQGLLKHERRLNFIHRSVVEFLEARRGSAFVLSKSQGLLLLMRSKIGHGLLRLSGSLEGLIRDDGLRKDGELVTVLNCGGEVDWDPKEMHSLMAIGLLDMAALVEREELNLSDADKELRVAMEEVINMAGKLAREIPNKAGEVVWYLPWKNPELDLCDELDFWARNMFSRALTYINESQETEPQYWDRILEGLAASSVYANHPASGNLAPIVLAILKRGANPQRALVVDMGPNFCFSFSINVYALFLYRLMHYWGKSPSNDLAASAVEFVEYCIKSGSYPNSGYLFYVGCDRDRSAGSIVQEVSIQSMIRYYRPWRENSRILRALGAEMAQPLTKSKYWVDGNLDTYELSESQSNYLSKLPDFDNNGLPQPETFYNDMLGGLSMVECSSWLDEANSYINSTIGEARRLGSMWPFGPGTAVVLGDESTYDAVSESAD